eukprot:COSAG02_NODE_14352_length_1281_cov_1.391709_1_plen_42_part_10
MQDVKVSGGGARVTCHGRQQFWWLALSGRRGYHRGEEVRHCR